MTRIPLKVNTASEAMLGPTVITPLELSIDDHNFVHNFIVCTKLKQDLILRLEFAQRYRLGKDWDIYGKLFLICEGKKIVTSL